MKKIISITVTVMSLMFLTLFIPSNTVHAALPEYCSDATGSVVCEITILPYSQPGSYSPEIAEIPAGASIVFKNAGPEIHTATSTDASPDASPADASSMINGIFDTGIVGIDGVADPIVLNDDGVFYYYCAVHPDMRGTIIVGGATSAQVTSSENTSSDSTNSVDLEFSAISSSDTSITGGELPLTKIKSVGNTAYIIDGITPKGGHDAFSYDGSGHKKITGNVQVNLDPITNTGSITAEWTDLEGNKWTYQQTQFAGGNEMYIGETIDGVTQTTLDLDPVA
ncbi:MAG: hypothetical protein CO032_03030, partial [Nitrosopumilales archaeon CG_4_9_14_0_2_um_filter_34_16]